MNGEFARELSQEGALTAPGQIARYLNGPDELLNNVFLSCLTRLPNESEKACFLPQLQPGSD